MGIRFSELVKGIELTEVSLGDDPLISGIEHDSRRIERGGLFVAIRGQAFDGRSFIDAAKRKGAAALLTDDIEAAQSSGMPYALAELSRDTMGFFASRLNGEPSRSMKLIGVTGTNGKTSTAWMISGILNRVGLSCGVVGTLGARLGEREWKLMHTTPESNELQRLLREMAEGGAQACAMEASSHGIVLGRLNGMHFSGLAFTNITQDHLDFHADMEEYAESKMELFKRWGGGAVSAINIDDEWGSRFVEACTGKVLTFGTSEEAEYRTSDARCTLEGTSFKLHAEGGEHDVRLKFIGDFNVENACAALVAVRSQGIELKAAIDALAEVPPVSGRMERVDMGQPFLVVVDYSHSPGSLKSVLKTLSGVEHGRIITVFGAGGDRDRSKRPLMREAAEEHSDLLVVTSDNPRTEKPEAIIDEIMEGCYNLVPTHREVDRAKAIEQALKMAEAGDIVLIAGKGHETYQEVHGVRTHFDDREIARGVLKGLLG